jgi:hypothetical protein
MGRVYAVRQSNRQTLVLLLLGRRYDKPLPDAQQRAGQVVAALELPDAFARITGVVPGGDRPERIRGLNDVDLLMSPTGGLPRDDHSDHRGDEQDPEQLYEHVFAILLRTRVRVNPRASYVGRTLPFVLRSGWAVADVTPVWKK